MTRIFITAMAFLLLFSLSPSCQTDRKTNPEMDSIADTLIADKVIPTDSMLLLAFNGRADSTRQSLMQVMEMAADKIQNTNNLKKTKRISDYDKTIKKTAKKIGWDWRLLAALIYQESKFQPDLESRSGAFGLMQLMPIVMERFEIDYDSSPEEQIEAGGKLIMHLDSCLEIKVTNSAERVKFVLAAYNAGLGHVYDAQRLAEKYGKSPDKWNNNVDFFILNKSKAEYYNDPCCRNGYLRGIETYRFVEQITKRYHHYRLIIN